MSKHTAGPWFYDIHERSLYIFDVEDIVMVADGDPDDVGIARMRGTGRGADAEEQEANARIIATAPELLEACKVVLAYLDKLEAETAPSFDPELSAMRKRFHTPLRAALEPAIRKAEGAQ